MKILRIICMLTIIAGLVIGGAGSALAKGPPEGSPGGGLHSPDKYGLFGTVISVDTITYEEKYIIHLETEQGVVHVTANSTAKYMAPREIRGPKNLEAFVDAVDQSGEGDLEELVDRRLAILVTNLVEVDEEFTADAMRLMLIPIAPPLHAHRVGTVNDFTPYTPDEDGTDGSIEIIDKDGVSHTFVVAKETVYHPEGTTAEGIEDIVPNEGCVTVVTNGDPKQPENLVAKAIVLHEELPDWAN